jgi:hypothetical protein
LTSSCIDSSIEGLIFEISIVMVISKEVRNMLPCSPITLAGTIKMLGHLAACMGKKLELSTSQNVNPFQPLHDTFYA